MTENHHVDTRVETARLRRMMGSGQSMDSFGEIRWMGALANTRRLVSLWLLNNTFTNLFLFLPAA